MPTSTPPSTPRAARPVAPEISRRTLVLSALALVVVLVAGVAIVAVTTDEAPRQDTQGQLAEDGGAKPHIIPRPGDGAAPQNPGDRGGWEQLGVFGVMAGAMLAIGVVVFRGGRRSRAGRQQWMAAGATGLDGALESHDHLAPGVLTPAAPPDDAPT